MIRLIVPIALMSLIAAPVVAQTAAPAPAATAAAETAAVPEKPKPALVRVNIQTSAGLIVLDLEKERAPLTTANFLRYVDQKRLDGTAFYRVVKLAGAPELGLIQGGISNNPKLVLPPVRHEPTSTTGLAHVDGTISMARTAPGTAAGDFFITIGALPPFDANPAQPGDNLGFAAFGHVAEGMDVVKRILSMPVSPTAGPAAMKGQMLTAPVKIITARRAQPAAAAR